MFLFPSQLWKNKISDIGEVVIYLVITQSNLEISQDFKFPINT